MDGMRPSTEDAVVERYGGENRTLSNDREKND